MNDATTQTYDNAQQRRGRIIAAAIMLIVALPMIVASVIYHTGIGMPTGTVNKGDLLSPPQSIDQLQLRDADGNPWQADTERKRWRMLIPATGQCDEQCQQNLYITRQVHVRLGKDAYRVERLFVLLDDTLDVEMQDFFREEHPGLVVLNTESARLNDLLAATDLAGINPVAEGRYFLVDQNGYLMMSYNPEHTGKELLADVKKMLKVSYEE
ncbi:MAG TPA: hypothetical protein VGP45_02380 [Marinobacter sp.]|nr:hypothetical protein [Marinobacter sp.]